jgi:YD repeat-containing protein
MPSGTTSVTYNAAGEITQYVTPQGTHQRTYNAAGQLTSTTDVGIGTTTYAYDSAGRIQSTTDAWNETTSISYDALGRVQRRTLSTGVYDQLGYDSRSRVVSIITAETSGTPIRTRTFSYDIINQVISSSVNGVATNYNYDLVGQLTSEVRAGFSAQYAYDANGNRLSKTVNGVSESYSYDSADKLLAVSGGNDPRTFGYDAAGRMTSVQRAAGTTFLAYDFDDRVVQIQDPTGVQNHTYDSLDARISSTFGGVTRNYRRSGAGSWAPVVSDGTALFSPGVAERRGGTTTYLHADTGSTDLQTTAAGAALAGREFSAFGELVQAAGTWQGQSGFMGLENFGNPIQVGNGGGVYDPGTGRVGTPGAGGRNDYTPGSGGPSNRLHPTIDFVPADEGGPYTAPWEWEDFFAGWGDTLTWGGTRQVRVWIGCDDVVDYGSGSYRVGEIVGEVHDQAMGGKGRAAKVAKQAAEEVAERSAKVGGRLGGKDHRATAERLGKAWEAEGGTIIGGGGGSEVRLETPNGRKKYRYPDFWGYKYVDGERVEVIIQVVRYLKDGKTLPKREREALEDMRRERPWIRFEHVAAGS